MIDTGVVDRERLLAGFEEIEPRLFRFPAIDPSAFRTRVERAVQ